MAGTCKRCGGMTTNTRAASVAGQCFNCQHGLSRDPEPRDFGPERTLENAEEKLAEFDIKWEEGTGYVFTPEVECADTK